MKKKIAWFSGYASSISITIVLMGKPEEYSFKGPNLHVPQILIVSLQNVLAAS